jgi:L-cysteine S-thiosulfotransferase
MRSILNNLTVGAICLVIMFVTFGYARADSNKVLSGRELTFSTAKGNCLACHQMPGDPDAVTSANIGPPLIAMKERYPDRAKLRAQIWDATAFNPSTVMPPFGKHKILTESEIDRILDYVANL